eukprot:2031139-Pleurochrysis_carterae.AAC.3
MKDYTGEFRQCGQRSNTIDREELLAEPSSFKSITRAAAQHGRRSKRRLTPAWLGTRGERSSAGGRPTARRQSIKDSCVKQTRVKETRTHALAVLPCALACSLQAPGLSRSLVDAAAAGARVTALVRVCVPLRLVRRTVAPRAGFRAAAHVSQ